MQEAKANGYKLKEILSGVVRAMQAGMELHKYFKVTQNWKRRNYYKFYKTIISWKLWKAVDESEQGVPEDKRGSF